MRIVLSSICVLIGMSASLTTLAAPREFFVAADGNDAAAGTETAPFGTVERALRAVRLQADGDVPVTVYLRGGTYRLTRPLVFTPEDSGTERAPVTYRSYPGERAVLSGGRRLTGTWQACPGRPYYRLAVPRAAARKWVFNSLFVNGMSRPRARTPNWGEKVYRAEGPAPGEDARQAFRYRVGDIDPAWTNLTDADLVLLCSWTPTIHRIEDILPDRRVVRFHSSHTRAVDFWERSFRYYVANVLEALDTPGEWYLERDSGTLYYYPLPGEDLDAAEVVAPILKSRLVTFAGDVATERFVEHVVFQDLDFRHVDGDLDRYNGVYRQGHMYLDAALWARGLRHAVFRNCVMAQLGEYALELGDGCRHVTVQQCHIWDTGAGAMQLGVSTLGQLLAARHQVRPGDMVVEAESAELAAPMVTVADDSASGGRYVVLPAEQTGGAAAFPVTVPAAGRYRFFACVIAPDGSSDSFYVQVDDGPRYTYDTGGNRSWFVSAVVTRELGGEPLIVPLSKGQHTVTLHGREAGTRVDFLMVRPVPENGSGNVAEDWQSEAEVLHLTIDNNVIHRLGTLWHGCYGIVNRFASFTQITHNDIFDTHWDAIGLDARWSYNGTAYAHGNVVAYNHLHHLGLGYHTDAGGVYQFGPLDTHIHHNVIHHTTAYPYICGYAGIYLDEQSRHAVVEKNLVYRVDWPAYFQHKGVDNVFRNNIGAFARDGLIHRGGLNEHWRANHLEACRNLYVTDDSIALRHGWQPGERPPELHHNMYYSLTTGTEVTFAGKSFAEWQADGHDRGSIVGDPGFTDPSADDFSLRADAPAVAAVGFEPFDDEMAQAGLYGPPEWRSLPERCSRRQPTAVWTPAELAKLAAFELDFEDMPVGFQPSVFRLKSDGDATFAVTDEAAATGRHSYRCVDRSGLQKPFYPYIHMAPRRLDEGRVRLRFDAMLAPDRPARFYVECRGRGLTSDVGPSVSFETDGRILAAGDEVFRAAPGSWVHVDLLFELGERAPRSYTLVLAGPSGGRQLRLPFRHETFAELRWLGVSASEDADGVFYLDNLALELE